ncbi:hypothetical protein [Hyalangium versicolor]|uniref:hypothetical protein n=1 Tax=Hyalangium versicolor TaxID=2861190 RepID=UPI001CCD0C6E|nr:hypothetical protein [Hyalangium versicolor]
MRALGVVLGLLLLTGCRGVPWRYDAYDAAVRVEALDLRFAPDGTGLLALKLEVRNPSSDPALLIGVDFDLAVDGRRLAEGLQQVEVPVGEDGRAQSVEVSFPLTAQGAPGTASRLSHQVQLMGGGLLRYGPRTERRAAFRVERVMEVPWLPPPEPLLE